MALSKQARKLAERLSAFHESLVDEMEVRSLCFYVQNQQKFFWPPGNDKVLFVFVAILYLSRLGGKEREALLEELQRRHKLKATEFHLVVEFAAQLNPRFGLDREMDEDAGELLREMWQSFCGSKGARVASGAPAHLSDYCVEESPRKPVRPAPPFDFGESMSFAACQWDCSNGRGTSYESGGKSVTGDVVELAIADIFDTVCNLVQSSYFYCLPVENLGWNLRRAVSSYTGLSDTVEEHYSELEGDPEALPKVWGMRPGKEQPVSVFRIGEARLLLLGISGNKLLRSLVLQRPPNSTLPHYYTLSRATAHARLWLGRYDLRIYCDYSLTYGELCSGGAAEAESKALGAFLMERGPSVVEDMLRQLTLNRMWCEEGDESKLLNMRPEDFEALPQEAVEADKALYQAVQQLGHPTVEGQRDVLTPMVCAYAPLLELETAPKKNFLLRHGVPKHLDMLHDSSTVLRLAHAPHARKNQV